MFTDQLWCLNVGEKKIFRLCPLCRETYYNYFFHKGVSLKLSLIRRKIYVAVLERESRPRERVCI